MKSAIMKPVAASVLLSSMLLGGCASFKGEQQSIAGIDPAVVAQKDREIAELSDRLARSESALTEEQKARIALASAPRQTELLPPDAKPGQCFARVFVPPQYSVEQIRVLKREAASRVETTEPVYEWVEERVLVKEASEKLEVVPATYEWVEERVLVKPATTRIEVVPAKYRTVTEKVLDKPEHTVWKKGTGPITRIDEATGEIMCLVTVPATYKTISKKVLVSAATTREVPVPAEYKTLRKRVLKTPPATRKITIPAEYKTVKVRRLVKPAQSRTTEIPAEYETVSQRKMVTDGRVEWRPVLCRTNMTPDMVRRIQTALQKAGFNPGPIDGIIGRETLAAVKAFQQSRGLPTGGLTYPTLEALGIRA